MFFERHQEGDFELALAAFLTQRVQIIDRHALTRANTLPHFQSSVHRVEYPLCFPFADLAFDEDIFLRRIHAEVEAVEDRDQNKYRPDYALFYPIRLPIENDPSYIAEGLRHRPQGHYLVYHAAREPI